MTDYDSINAINCSGLKLFEEAQAHYYYKHIAKTWEGEKSDAFRLGSFAHTMVLEPEKIDADWRKVDPPLGKGKDAKPLKSGKDYDAWLETMTKDSDQRWYTTDEESEVLEWVKALKNHPAIQVLLEHPDRKIEKTLVAEWGEAEFVATDFKGRCDLIIPYEGIIVDVKTSVSELPGKFRRIAYNYDYHMQAALYMKLAKAKYNKPFRFLFAVVSKSDKQASLIELPGYMIEQGENKLKKQASRLIQARLDWLEGQNIPGDWRKEVCVCD